VWLEKPVIIMIHTPDLKSKKIGGQQWLMPIILATQETEIRRIAAQSQPGQMVYETLS
jgi:hypothetical protein